MDQDAPNTSNQRTIERERPIRRRRSIESQALSDFDTPGLTIKKALGDCPPLNDKCSTIVDPFEKKLYMIGGILCGDRSNVPTSDIAVCDVSKHILLSPDDEIKCLDIQQKIFELDTNFQDSVYVDGKLCLLGSDQDDGPNAKYNIYIDIPWAQ